MKQHLSHEQFAQCFAGRNPDPQALQHIQVCAQCRAELERFGSSVANLQEWIRWRVNVQPPSPRALEEQRTSGSFRARSGLRWAAAAAALILGGMPLWLPDPAPQHPEAEAAAQVDPSELMDAVSLHLSREVPSPLEAIWVISPSVESTSVSGGVQ
jgi:anti-sigma factor RsiW